MQNMKETEKIINAFPKEIRAKADSLLKKISLKSEHKISQTFSVMLNGEKLEIPDRIYFEEVSEENLDKIELLILNCLFTRHYNGFIRHRNLKSILSAKEYWISPFIFQLIGEYVIEILFEIEKDFSDNLLTNLAKFSQENPEFYRLTKSRVISYWNCYYRSRFKNFKTYTGFKILEKINAQSL